MRIPRSSTPSIASQSVWDCDSRNICVLVQDRMKLSTSTFMPPAIVADVTKIFLCIFGLFQLEQCKNEVRAKQDQQSKMVAIIRNKTLRHFRLCEYKYCVHWNKTINFTCEIPIHQKQNKEATVVWEIFIIENFCTHNCVRI